MPLACQLYTCIIFDVPFSDFLASSCFNLVLLLLLVSRSASNSPSFCALLILWWTLYCEKKYLMPAPRTTLLASWGIFIVWIDLDIAATINIPTFQRCHSIGLSDRDLLWHSSSYEVTLLGNILEKRVSSRVSRQSIYTIWHRHLLAAPEQNHCH